MKNEGEIMKKELLVCPKCGSERILRKEVKEVRIWDCGSYVEDEELSLWSADYEYECMDCGEDLTNVELIRKSEWKGEKNVENKV